MQFSVTPEIFERFPSLTVGIIVCRNMRTNDSSPEILKHLREAEVRARAAIPDPERLKEHPTIAAWQEAHRTFGSNPNKFPSSIHALLKRVTKGNELPSINALVDLYNVISLKYIVPVGGEDLDQCRGDIRLTIADGTESFTAIGETTNESPEPGEVIYRDDAGVLCRKFNWREAARTCLTHETKNAVLVIEAIPPTTRSELEAAMKELSELAQKFAGAITHMHVLDITNQAIIL